LRTNSGKSEKNRRTWKSDRRRKKWKINDYLF